MRAENLSTGQASFGTFDTYVQDWTPSNDPRNWTDSQIKTMSAMAVQETMWNLHRSMDNLGGSGAQVIGQSPYDAATSQYIEFFADNGRLPAYMPGSLNGQTLPQGFEAANDQRWQTDPYADTVMRLVNSELDDFSSFSVTSGEGNTTGYNSNGTVQTANRIAGTTDGAGLNPGGNLIDGGNSAASGAVLSAFNSVMPALAGTPVQVGANGVNGQSFEFVTQQVADYLTYGQIDGGGAKGAWYYNPEEQARSAVYATADGTAWAMNGLDQTNGSMYGVMTPNDKYRVAELAVNGQNADGGYAWRVDPTRYGSGINDTAEMLHVLRGLGADTFSVNDSSSPFPNETNVTRGQLRQAHDRAIAYLANEWNKPLHRDGIGHGDGFWDSGDYLQGNTNAVYNATDFGNNESMFWVSEAAKAGAVGLDDIGPHDWKRQFNTYLMRAQSRFVNANDPWQNYQQFGEVRSDSQLQTWPGTRGVPHWSTVYAGMTMTPSGTLADPSFEAQAAATPTVELSSNNIDFGNVRAGDGIAVQDIDATFSGSLYQNEIQGQLRSVNGNGFLTDAVNGVPLIDGKLRGVGSYAFSPTANGNFQANAGFDSDIGVQDILLTGTGVGPVFASSVAPDSTIDLGQFTGDSLSADSLGCQLTLSNDFGTDLGDSLTGLTLLSATFSGPDANEFSLTGFTPGMTLSALEEIMLGIHFNNLDGSLGLHQATLTFLTDQNAAFGQAGDSFSFLITADQVAAAVPEPSTWAFLTLAGIGFGGWQLRRRNKAQKVADFAK